MRAGKGEVELLHERRSGGEGGDETRRDGTGRDGTVSTVEADIARAKRDGESSEGSKSVVVARCSVLECVCVCSLGLGAVRDIAAGGGGGLVVQCMHDSAGNKECGKRIECDEGGT